MDSTPGAQTPQTEHFKCNTFVVLPFIP